MNLVTGVEPEVEILPDEDLRLETLHHVDRFVRQGFSGQITITLNFSKGTRQPSEVIARRLQVGSKEKP